LCDIQADVHPSSPAKQDFMNVVAAECKRQKHHPEWTNVFNKTHIRWTTHNPEGLSRKDTEMARFCDEAGKQFGEAEPEDEVASCYGPGGKPTT
jgi:4a-hydroxytetrahydrobiopterin dehydratase